MKILIALIFTLVVSTASLAQTTEFTYQGRLTDGSLAANANYDFEIVLFDALTGGTQIATATRNGVPVSGGIFTVGLDFGAPAFAGANRFLEIRVKLSSDPPGFTTLTPRQPVTSAPYSVRSLNAAAADIAANAQNLNGQPASNFVQTNDARLSDARTPTAGSGFYIQNGTGLQPTSDFNINGIGKAFVFDALREFRIGGNRVLVTDNANQNTFVGINTGPGTSGISNSVFGRNAGAGNTGDNNSFFGRSAGSSNAAACCNSFFGSSAGSNTTGLGNSFFGSATGSSNTTGESNSFFGLAAGQGNTTGINNTMIGTFANAGSNNLTFATAIGAGSIVNASSTVVLGRAADTVQVPGIINSATQYNIGGNRVLSIGGNQNAFVGRDAGSSNTSGGNNSFFGNGAGNANTTGGANSFFGFETGKFNTGNTNSFFGARAGFQNTTGGENAFFGNNAGQSNTTGFRNDFFGRNAGFANTTGTNNSFFGDEAGNLNTIASDNSFFGSNAGAVNTTGGANSFFGHFAGRSNTTSANNSFFGDFAGSSNATGANNSFFGRGAGNFNTTGDNNSVFGVSANVSSGALNFATAIGSGATVSTSNTLVLGRNLDTVQVPGGLNVTGTFTASGAGITNLNALNLTGVVPIANGGTGSATQNFVDLASVQTVGGSKTFSSTTRVTNGSSGATPVASADLVVEDNSSAFQHFLTPDDSESGILFGDPTLSIGGGIVFNNAATNNGIQFRTGGNTTQMTLDGSGRLGIGVGPAATLHVGGAGGDNSVILPSDAISAGETLDEPGVASAISIVTTALDGTIQTLLSRDITVPTAGFVLVIGSLQASLSHATTIISQAHFGVSDISGSLPLNQDVTAVMPAALPTAGNYNLPVTVHGLFQVAAAGTHTFFLIGDEISGGWSVGDLQLTLLFVPTSYGTVTPTFSETPPGKTVRNLQTAPEMSSTGPAITLNTLPDQNAPMLEQLKRQQLVIDQLKQIVCTLRPDAAVCKEGENK